MPEICFLLFIGWGVVSRSNQLRIKLYYYLQRQTVSLRFVVFGIKVRQAMLGALSIYFSGKMAQPPPC